MNKPKLYRSDEDLKKIIKKTNQTSDDRLQYKLNFNSKTKTKK